MAVPLDFFLSKNVRKSNSCNGEYLVWNDIFSRKISSEIVIYGSSKAWVGLSPQILEDSLKCTVYNLGIDGHNFWLQYLRHLELLKFNPPPKLILLSVDMFSLEKKRELYNFDQFLPYMLFNKDIYKYTSSYLGFSLSDFILPLARYIGRREALINAILYSFKVPKARPMRIKGYMGIDAKWNNDFDNAIASISQYEVLINSESKELFERFLLECSQSGIKIIMIYSPEYIGNRDFFKNRSEIITLYRTYAKKYCLPFLDYSDNPMCQVKEYFYNSTHLNKTGSELFSAILANDLKSLSECSFKTSNNVRISNITE